MKDKINIAELLKNCPKGMELDCTIFDGVYFDHVDDLRHNSIKCYVNNGNEHFGIAFDEHGQYLSNKSAKCVIFPKGKTTWEGFKIPFKDGDILTTNIGSIFIFSHLEFEWHGERNICKAYVGIRNTMPISLFHTDGLDIFGPYESMCRLATEEEKEKLFQAIKENGYRWNSETKTLEKLTPNKFDINTLVSFESKVLVRDNVGEKWNPGIWGYYDTNASHPYKVIGCVFKCCIPYEGNEHLLGTTNDCDEYFKTWK